MPKPLAWAIIAALIAGAIWLVARRWQDVGPVGLLIDTGIIAVSIAITLAAGALCLLAIEWLKRAYKKRFVPPPWHKPRIVHELQDREEYIALSARLDPVDPLSRHPRISFHRDRLTGQLWQRSVWDVGHANSKELKPVNEAALADDDETD